MEKCKIIINGNTLLVSKYNKQYNITVFAYFENNQLKGIDFNQDNNNKITINKILYSESSILLKKIISINYSYNIEESLLLSLHISQILLTNIPIIQTYFVLECDDVNKPTEIKSDMWFDINEKNKLEQTLQLANKYKLNYKLYLETFNNKTQEIENRVYLIN